jgi:acyl-CoA thioester hydrolase
MIRPDEPFPTPDTWFKLVVSYGETDARGVVYYANHPRWFERARGQLLRERGLSYAEVERRGFLLPVRELSVRYLAPARYDDEILVRAGVSLWGRASITFAYQVFGPPGGAKPVCLGATQHACVNPAGKPIAVPTWLKDAFSL